MKKTNFLQGLYSDEELSSAYLKEGRDNKTIFMKKLVTAVCKYRHSHTNKNSLVFFIYLDIAVKRPPDVRVSKILAGQEADKTNILLQTLAEAINLDVDNNEVVRKTLQSLGGETNENEEPSRSRERKDAESSERRRSKDERPSKSHEREEPAPERKSTAKEATRVKFILTNVLKFCLSSKRIKLMEIQVVIQNDGEVLARLMIVLMLMRKENLQLHKDKMMMMTMTKRLKEILFCLLNLIKRFYLG